jgi:hypothetical protein
MQTQIAALYERTKTKYKITLHGGQMGLSNSVSWVYLAEDIHNISFLKGGELAITTGLFIQSGVSLLDFIRGLAMNNCSGVLINIGKYLSIDDLTPEVLSFCNINKVPLFTMPWEVHLVDIMQDYCSLLLHDNQRQDNLSAAFQSTLYQSPVPENILRTLNQFGFVTQADYRVLAIRNLHDVTRITSPLNSYNLKYHLFYYDNLQIMIYNSTQEQLSLNGVMEIVCFCDSIILGVSDIVHSLAEIGMCYKRARFSLAASELWNRPFVKFEDLGLFQILFSSSDPGLLQNIYKRSLGILEQYDMEHDSDYMNTLRIFLLSDCNLLETSSRLYTHRNTIVYRIRKIKELLNTELDNSAVKFDLLMAFYIKEYLSM